MVNRVFYRIALRRLAAEDEDEDNLIDWRGEMLHWVLDLLDFIVYCLIGCLLLGFWNHFVDKSFEEIALHVFLWSTKIIREALETIGHLQRQVYFLVV